MKQFFTAKSYENDRLLSKPYEKDGKMYVDIFCKCKRCGGTGVLKEYDFVNDGICFKCNGAGGEAKTVRAYTEEERALLDKAAEKRQLDNFKKALLQRQDLEKNSEENKKIWMTNHNFGEDGLTWCIFGDNTYEIKEWLKEQGCKFDPIFKWYSNHCIDLPEGYGMFSISFDEVFNWDMYAKTASFKEDAKETVERKFLEAEGPSKSEYVGEVGERLRNLTVTYKSARGFSGAYGWTNIYTFESGENVLVWFTAKDLDLEKGTIVDLTATVKKHEEFRGVKTTQLSRAIIKEMK